MAGLHVDHAEAVVNGYTGTLVLGQVVVWMGLSDGEGFPQAALTVIGDGAGNGERLGVHVVDTFRQRMAFIHRFRLHFVHLSELPGDVRETAALATESHHLVTIAVAVGFFVQLQLVVVVERHQHVTGALIGPVHVGNAAVVALEVFDHQVRTEKGIGNLACGQAAHAALESQIEPGVITLEVVGGPVNQQLRIANVRWVEYLYIDGAEQV